jgi:clathrin heavy chain
MVGKQDKALALKIYQDGGLHNKVVDIYNELGRVDEAMSYAQKNGIKVDVGASLKTMIDSNPEGALQYAKKLYQKDKTINVHQIADLFLQRNRIQ